VVAWLRPSNVVAKAGAGRHPRLQIELEVALELAALSAPVVSPAAEVPAVVHWRDGLPITFWRYHPQPDEAEIAAGRTLAALALLHAALARISPGLRARLPPYMQDLLRARTHIDSPGIAALALKDRQLLADTFDSLQRELDARSPREAHGVIHGSPHAYNVLCVDGEPRFIDFETVCTGPAEWDLVHVEEEGAGADETRLRKVCREMASVVIAIWCWSEMERGDLREHAQWHLDRVRRMADRTGR
jgi:Ser/Thr protein kinase RdoA (MazF antagonist)